MFKEREEYLFKKYDDEKVELFKQLRNAEERAEQAGEIENNYKV